MSLNGSTPCLGRNVETSWRTASRKPVVLYTVSSKRLDARWCVKWLLYYWRPPCYDLLWLSTVQMTVLNTVIHFRFLCWLPEREEFLLKLTVESRLYGPDLATETQKAALCFGFLSHSCLLVGVLLCSPRWPGTHDFSQPRLELTGTPPFWCPVAKGKFVYFYCKGKSAFCLWECKSLETSVVKQNVLHSYTFQTTATPPLPAHTQRIHSRCGTLSARWSFCIESMNTWTWV